MFLTIGQFEVSFGQFDSLSSNSILTVIIGILVGFIALVLIIKFIHNSIKRHFSVVNSFNRVLLLIQLPKHKKVDDRTDASEVGLQKIQEDIGVMQAFLNSIAGLTVKNTISSIFKGRNDHFSLEIVSHNDKIVFYVGADRRKKTYIEQQIQAQFPHAYIEEVSDYNIFQPQGEVEVAYLKLKRENFFPIKSFKNLTSDPLNGITNMLSKVDSKDGIAIQYIVRSAKKKWRSPGIRLASAIKQGKKPREAIAQMNENILLKVLNTFGSLFKEASKSKEDSLNSKMEDKYVLSPLEEEMVKALEEKSQLLGMDVNLRIIAAASNSETARMYLDNLINVYSQYSLPEFGNSFEVFYPRNKKLFIKEFIHRSYSPSYSFILNTEEFSSLYHFPLPSLDTPKISWLLSKKAPPPSNLIDGPILGYNEYRGNKLDITVGRKDRRRHMYIIGTTGTGKTTLSINMITQDILNGEGCCYIDPHGDAIEDILKIIPRERADDVIIFDPSDLERPMGLNLLEYKNKEQMTFVIDEMIRIFDKLYDLSKTGGPRFEQYVRNAMLLIMADPASGSTLMEVPKVLSDAAFRKYKLRKCSNMVVRDFWIKEAEKAGGEASLANMTTYITSKLTPFVANDMMRPIISQQQSTLNLEDIMNNQKILLLYLPKGKIGEMNMQLLGMIMVARILLASFNRVDIPEYERKDFYLYIDEFQNFITDSISTILSEARKYRLNLVMAHQYIDQLVKDGDTRVRDAVFGNVGSFISFRIGPNDLDIMTKQFAPVFTEYDLLNCPARSCFAKLMVDNANPPPFNMTAYKPRYLDMGNDKIAKAIRQISRLKYGRDRRIVEAEIKDRVRQVEILANSGQ